MKRKGYPETFNKDTLEQEISLEKLEIEETKKEYAELMSKFTVNIVEFVVGVTLLVFCYMYLMAHPAERTSLFTGIEVIVQKTKVMVSNITGGNGETIENKYKLEQTFDEIIGLAVAGDCLTSTDLDKVQRASTALKTMSIEDFSEKERTFKTTASLYYTKVRKECSEGEE